MPQWGHVDRFDSAGVKVALQPEHLNTCSNLGELNVGSGIDGIEAGPIPGIIEPGMDGSRIDPPGNELGIPELGIAAPPIPPPAIPGIIPPGGDIPAIPGP